MQRRRPAKLGSTMCGFTLGPRTITWEFGWCDPVAARSGSGKMVVGRPRLSIPQDEIRSIEDIEVQLCTADGKQVASVRSSNMGFYLLPFRDAPWDVYPVAAEVRVLLDGKVLGEPLKIECNGMDGLYPDDVYDVVIE